MLDKALSIIAPHLCRSCGEKNEVLCDCCKNYIINEPFPNCLACGTLLIGGNLCEKHHLPYSRAWCVSRREGVLKQIIDEYKFDRVRSASRVLAQLLDQRLPDLPKVEIVPVPTTPRNIRLRGYDHISLIANDLADYRGWRISPLLARRNNTTQHFAKTANERREQAKTFFSVRGSVSDTTKYLVLDDIFTTGATLESATRCLRQAGAKEIWVAVIVRH